MNKIKHYRWVVWVGDIDDHYKDYDRAINDYNEWLDKGYDDVSIHRYSEQEYKDFSFNN
jgi:hypothetical protein